MAKAKTKVTKKAPALGLTAARRKRALECYASCGIFARVAEELKIGEQTLWRWRKEHPDFEEELDAAGRALDQRVGQKFRAAAEMHVDSVLAGERGEDKYGIVQKSGARVLVQRGERIPLNVAMARTALTKLDPTWTHPKQEVEHSGELTLLESIKAARERMAQGDDDDG